MGSPDHPHMHATHLLNPIPLPVSLTGCTPPGTLPPKITPLTPPSDNTQRKDAKVGLTKIPLGHMQWRMAHGLPKLLVERVWRSDGNVGRSVVPMISNESRLLGEARGAVSFVMRSVRVVVVEVEVRRNAGSGLGSKTEEW